MLQLPQTTTAKVTHSPKAANADISDDPIIARIARLKQLQSDFVDECEVIERAENELEKLHGRRPFALIAWRNYGAIGGSELERCRDEFILLGLNPADIKKEYADAKRRYRKRLEAIKRWDEQTGFAKINAKKDRILRERRQIEASFVKEPPQTVAGAATVIRYLHEQVSEGNELTELELGCLKATAEALASMSRV